MASPAQINVGLLGMGVVGCGVAAALIGQSRDIALKIGRPVKLKKVLVRNLGKHTGANLPPGILTTNPEEILNNNDIHVVVEVMGGTQPAAGYMNQALASGKHVVTANKEVIAKYGPSLISLAHRKGVNLLYEASVGGGIPIVGNLMRDLAANNVHSIKSIINGTTNYILTRMANDGAEFSQALIEAQQRGYAEADPTNDVEGIDAVYKISILASLAFHRSVSPGDVYRQGITRLEPQDFRYASELGYAIKSLAIATLQNGNIKARVYPALLPLEHMLAKVDGVYNAVEVEGDLCGKVLFHGMGAGREPTTSAVMGDVIEASRSLVAQDESAKVSASQNASSEPDSFDYAEALTEERETGSSENPIDDLICKYYLRLNVQDRPGVFAQIGKVLGDGEISIASVLQKDTNQVEQTAEIVITTHPSIESSVQASLKALTELDVVRNVSNVLRIEE
ncbi:MAG TPA: homoserine dehydrogenase [Dehalococcoidia bacterium]|nr:homoserine dehydrogenase [Dehalococcoidia bacterium]